MGLALWFDYPGHVLADVGMTPYASYGFPNPFSPSIIIGELDPFVLWKPKLSPFPALSLTLAVLLAGGLILLGLEALGKLPRLRPRISRLVSSTILLATVTIFSEASLILIISGLNTTAAGAQSVTNLDEISILLFTCFELVALVPLLCALNFLTGDRDASHADEPTPPDPTLGRRSRSYRWRRDRSTQGSQDSVVAGGAVVLLLVPLSLGLGYSVEEVPSYLHDHIAALANVSAGDFAALEWVGAHLPDCSRVLVAPGSVAQYLPEYAHVQMVFPIFPPTVNLSYYVAVENFVQGVYLNSTRSDLVEIGVTTVFVTGQNSASYPPFQLQPFIRSSDFSLLFEQQDAAIFAFEPGVLASGCAP